MTFMTKESSKSEQRFGNYIEKIWETWAIEYSIKLTMLKAMCINIYCDKILEKMSNSDVFFLHFEKLNILIC